MATLGIQPGRKMTPYILPGPMAEQKDLMDTKTTLGLMAFLLTSLQGKLLVKVLLLETILLQ